MGREEIKKLVEDSKGAIKQNHDDFAKSIKDELSSFKRKTLDKIE